jgi:hypothetical protein
MLSMPVPPTQGFRTLDLEDEIEKQATLLVFASATGNVKLGDRMRRISGAQPYGTEKRGPVWVTRRCPAPADCVLVSPVLVLNFGQIRKQQVAA